MTHISRKSAVSDLSYEFRLEQAIKVSGFLTSLVGPSKMGKTILCEKVIGLEKIVEVSGADFDENTDFWKLAASKVGLAYEGQFSSEKIIPDTRDKYEKKEVYALTKDKIIEYDWSSKNLHEALTLFIHEAGHAIGSLETDKDSFLMEGFEYREAFLNKFEEAVVSERQNEIEYGELNYTYVEINNYENGEEFHSISREVSSFRIIA